LKLADIRAQDAAVRALRSSISRSSVAHAYLFTGPRNCGKTTTALAFASALNCADPTPEGDACGRCMSCLRIQAGNDADVQAISPEKDQTTIDQMREMIRSLSFAPLSGKYRVYIVEQADTLNPSSENCILKVLEEPPPYAVLILLSSNPNSLLPTIRSRCRVVRFSRASTSQIEEVLSSLSLSDDERRVIAACSQGLVGKAIGAASGPEFMEERQAVLQALRAWANGPAVMGLQTAETIRKLAEPKKNDPDERTRIRRLTEMLDHVLSWYSDLLSMKVGGVQHINVDYADDLSDEVGRYSTRRLRRAIRSIMDTRRYLEGNITPQLALENLFFELRPDST
jgi:DNA polymerase-3 subunit delta'